MRVCVSHTLNFFVIRIRSVLFLLGPHAVPKMLYPQIFVSEDSGKERAIPFLKCGHSCCNSGISLRQSRYPQRLIFTK